MLMQDTLHIQPSHPEPQIHEETSHAQTVESGNTRTVETEKKSAERKKESETARKSTATQAKAARPRVEVPQYLAYPYVQREKAETTVIQESVKVATDSLATDSIVADTIVPGEQKEGIILINPAAAYRDKSAPAANEGSGTGMSWIYLILTILFCIAGVRFKGNTKYLKAVFSDLTDTRVRHNAFDDTVKETSLLVLLNILWIACAGILLWVLVKTTVPSSDTSSFGISVGSALGIGMCMGVAAAYQLLMFTAYWIVGNVFSEQKLTRLWLKGAGASSGLQTFVLFPLSLVALSYPAWSATSLIIAGIVFVIGKIVFLYKGFRIFFNQISSWLLFLYYLCSLEIVPLILTYVAAVLVCTGSSLF